MGAPHYPVKVHLIRIFIFKQQYHNVLLTCRRDYINMLKKISIFKKSSKKDGHAPKNTLGKTTGGFTLIEMIVAVFILTIAVGAPLYSAAVALKISREAQNRIVAEYLAQEALEFIRNRRDENILNGESDPYQ